MGEIFTEIFGFEWLEVARDCIFQFRIVFDLILAAILGFPVVPLVYVKIAEKTLEIQAKSAKNERKNY